MKVPQIEAKLPRRRALSGAWGGPRQRQEKVIDPDFRLEKEAQRRWLLRVEDGAFRGQQLDRPERALIGRRIGIGQGFEGSSGFFLPRQRRP